MESNRFLSMSNESDSSTTVGSAIDLMIGALEPLEASARRAALRTVCDLLSIESPDKLPPSPLATLQQLPVQSSTAGYPIDIRSLKEKKVPQTANEMAALVAYYLSESVPVANRRNEVNSADMEKYFKEAAFPLPKRPEQLLKNAKNSGYFEALGEGKFKLSPVGYNLIALNLPRSLGNIGKSPRRKQRKKKPRAKKNHKK